MFHKTISVHRRRRRSGGATAASARLGRAGRDIDPRCSKASADRQSTTDQHSTDKRASTLTELII